jgi:hypothetical protein
LREHDLETIRAVFFEEGRQAGLLAQGVDTVCPFPLEDHIVRSTWHDGVMIGRVEAYIRKLSQAE